VNVEVDKKSEESKVNEDNQLVRFEFIDIITRIAALKFEDEVIEENGYSHVNCAQAIEMLFQKNLLPHASPIVVHDPNTYRVVSTLSSNSSLLSHDIIFSHFEQRRLYKEDVDIAYKPHLKWLKKIHTEYSKNESRYVIKQIDMKRPRMKQPYIMLTEWVDLLDYYDLVLPDANFSYQEASYCFFWGKMRVSDELRRRIEWTSMTYMDFLEALARVGADENMFASYTFCIPTNTPDCFYYQIHAAEMKCWPVEEQFGEVGASTMTEFFERSMDDGLTLEDIFESCPKPPDFIEGAKLDKLGSRIEKMIQYMKFTGRRKKEAAGR
jgi:hypothetical protein